jgi:hypothetical protein
VMDGLDAVSVGEAVAAARPDALSAPCSVLTVSGRGRIWSARATRS